MKWRFFLLVVLIVGLAADAGTDPFAHRPFPSPAINSLEHQPLATQGALMASRFATLEDLQKVVEIEYAYPPSDVGAKGPAGVRLHHQCGNQAVASVLISGISEADLSKARSGGWMSKALLGIRSPFVALHRHDLLRVMVLARWRYPIFGEGDKAFYDIAASMVKRIYPKDLDHLPERDLSEKGFLNTFNHITAQALMTSLFSAELADFVGDVHERYHMPELMTGVFTDKQLTDLNKNPVDNYVDMINNEWGQRLGARLKQEFNVSRTTRWTPQLMADYLNAVLEYYHWALHVHFRPFRPDEELVQRYAHKLNRVMGDPKGLNQ
ncbi:MAG: hypothetical protein ACFB10_21630 [Salibacteraceae bacterium]